MLLPCEPEEPADEEDDEGTSMEPPFDDEPLPLPLPLLLPLLLAEDEPERDKLLCRLDSKLDKL